MTALTADDILATLPEAPAGPWPGMALAVIDKGEVVTRFCHGLASVEHGVPITADTVFRIASVTKQFLCLAVTLLSDEGHFDLDAPLGRYLPELQGVPATATLRQAMSNTSGIRDHLELWYLAGGGLPVPHRLADSLRICAQQKQTNFAPGSGYLYSNANFLLLSRIVEDAAGKPLGDFLKERFFDPLGMTRTRLRSQHDEVVPDLATPYVVKDGAIRRGRMTAELWGEGSAMSTLNDLILWAQYYRKDPQGLIARMRQPATFTNGNKAFYGTGLFVEDWRGYANIGHTGVWPGYHTEIVWFDQPDLALICIANANSIYPREVNRKLAAKLLDAPEPAGIALDPALWARAAGFGQWHSPDELDFIELKEVEGKPHAVIYGGSVPLRGTAPDRFVIDAALSEYGGFDLSQVADGVIRATRCNGEPVVFHALDTLPEGAGTAGLVGHWTCPELGTPLIVGCTDDGAYTVSTPDYWNHDWVATALPAGRLLIEDSTGPWARRFILVPGRTEGMTVEEMFVAGPRVRKLAYRRDPA